MANHVLLCLKCRQEGHDVEHCGLDEWAGELDWFFSPPRRHIDHVINVNNHADDEPLCSRCESLDLEHLFSSRPPWKSQMEFTDEFDEEQKDVVKKLGVTGTTQFWADCAVCCCLFGIMPQPSSVDQEIFLVPDWTISRVSGELGVVTMDSEEKRQYATCLLSVLKPSSQSLSTRIIAHRGDALCLLQSDAGPENFLGGRRIESQDINVDLILGWVKACIERHDESCLPVPTKALEGIRLVDTETRTIVKYPGPDHDYIALSYVCGDVTQSKYEVGDTVNTLSRTLEDAVLFTKRLGKRYIWIDSLCINQYDKLDKADQIDRMWGIYQGAWLTIITLSGTSANSGFPRFSREEQYPQLSCRIKGKTVVSLMPTLSQQIWTAPWGGRAWTLQEGLLSARCLYVGDHQMYYDCLSMQCCESLDDTNSWAHKLTPKSNPTEEGFVTWMLRQAGAGALRVPVDWPSRRLEHWGEKLNLYSYRRMTFAEDAIRAFTGVLQRLQIIYPKGFFWGLPYEDFDWALLWRSQVPPTRRTGFPSWSWAGWKGPLFFGQPMDVKKTRRIPIPLQIDAIKAGQVETIFHSKSDTVDKPGIELVIVNDPIHSAARIESTDPGFNLEAYPVADKEGHLFITAICLHFKPNFTKPLTKTYAAGQHETFSFTIKEVRCLIRITSTDKIIPGKWVRDKWVLDPVKQGKEKEKDIFILLARDYIQGFLLHHLMLIAPVDEGKISNEFVAERVTVLELLVPLDELDTLREFDVRKRRIILI